MMASSPVTNVSIVSAKYISSLSAYTHYHNKTSIWIYGSCLYWLFFCPKQKNYLPLLKGQKEAIYNSLNLSYSSEHIGLCYSDCFTVHQHRQYNMYSIWQLQSRLWEWIIVLVRPLIHSIKMSHFTGTTKTFSYTSL